MLTFRQPPNHLLSIVVSDRVGNVFRYRLATDLSTGWAMLLGRGPAPGAVVELPPSGLHPDRGLRLEPHPEFAALETSVPLDEASQRALNAIWCWKRPICADVV